MNLNELCRLAKVTEGLMRQCFMLSGNNYGVDIIATHNRSAVSEELKDEVIDMSKERKYDISIKEIYNLIESLISEKQRISTEIEHIKNTNLIDVDGSMVTMDTAIEYNSMLRNEIAYIKDLLSHKERIEKSRGSDYKLDIEGKQTAYYYPIETKYSPNFDRAVMQQKLKDLSIKADKMSIEIDKVKINSVTNETFKYDVNDTLDSIIQSL